MPWGCSRSISWAVRGSRHSGHEKCLERTQLPRQLQCILWPQDSTWVGAATAATKLSRQTQQRHSPASDEGGESSLVRLPRASIAIFPDMSDWEWSRLGGTLGLSQRKSTGQRRSCECWLKFERCSQQGGHTVASSSNIIEGRGSCRGFNFDGQRGRPDNGNRERRQISHISACFLLFCHLWRYCNTGPTI